MKVAETSRRIGDLDLCDELLLRDARGADDGDLLALGHASVLATSVQVTTFMSAPSAMF